MSNNDTTEKANPNQAAKYSSVDLRREALSHAVSIHHLSNDPTPGQIIRTANNFYAAIREWFAARLEGGA